MQALMLGDKTEFYKDTEKYDDMTRAGIMHVIAVSGMHVAFVVSILTMLFGLSVPGAVSSIALIWLFVFITGGNPSAVRAGLMQTAVLAAPLVKRENDPVTSLTFALAVILAENPFACADIGLQLSFGAMAGLIFLGGSVNDTLRSMITNKKLKKILAYPIATISSSVSIMFFTLPLMAVHFGYVSVVSPLTNILALWAVPYCFSGGYISAALSYVSVNLAIKAAALTSLPVRLIFGICKMLAGYSNALIYVDSRFSAVWMIFLYLALIPVILSKSNSQIKLVISVAYISLSAFIMGVCVKGLYNNAEAVFTVIDVGQGQCISVFSGDRTFMIDCGSSDVLTDAADNACAYLSKAYRGSIDVLFLTHLHEDHVNGVLSLMDRMRIGAIVLTDNIDDENGMYDQICKKAMECGIEIRTVRFDEKYDFGSVSFDIYAPADGSTLNERCLCLKITAGDFTALITGDSPKESEEQLIAEHYVGDTDLYIAGHHGSRYSSCCDLLKEMSASIAVISTGYNTYGHPTYETLERLDYFGYNVYRTDLNGDVEFFIGQGYYG